jgi:RNA polymerase sigma-70 factor (ECF subfamily)
LITEEDTLVTQAQAQESISMAFLVLLERLTPPERAVFLLREVFDYSYSEIAEIIGKEEAACRQIFRRAKQFIVAQRPRFSPSTEQHRRMLQGFLQAVGNGDMDALVRLLSDDVTMWTDGGGKIPGAATRPLHGPSSVARFIVGSMRYYPVPDSIEQTQANGEPAIIFRAGGVPVVFIGVTITDQAISELRIIANPEKLRSLS